MKETPIRQTIVIRFIAMGCPCELLVECDSPREAESLADLAQRECERLERRYSRYRPDSFLSDLNRAEGTTFTVDDETARLLDFADHAYRLSEGLFDVTTGILRHGPSNHLGWHQVQWQRPAFWMPKGFELDLGGLVKEYAADRVLTLLRAEHAASLLVNLGGDIAAAGTRVWQVGVEAVHRLGDVARTVSLQQGAIATSGTTKRGSHIVNPKTAQPVTGAPASVTVMAGSCTEAGFWSTLGMLHGRSAETFLEQQGLVYWCDR